MKWLIIFNLLNICVIFTFLFFNGISMIKRSALIGLIALSLSACSTVTIKPHGQDKISDEPTYQESQAFFLFGIIGEKHINVTEICNEKDPVQMQSQQTFVDDLLSAFTYGIYTPHTAKVWCK